MSFDTFSNRYSFHGVLMMQTGLHVGASGSSLDPVGSDSPIARDAAGRPLIPGSSFKGALRSRLEAMIRGLGSKRLWSCDPLAAPCVRQTEINQWKTEADWQDHLTDWLLGGHNTLPLGLCSICRLFGSPWMASRVLIKDLILLSDNGYWRVDVRDGVGIDRGTETARQGIKYDFEIVSAGTSFEVRIVVENVEPRELGLLLIGLREFQEGRADIGGKTSRGLGQASIDWRLIEIIEGGAGMLDFLRHGRGRLIEGEAAIQSFVTDQIGKLIEHIQSEPLLPPRDA